MYRILIVNFTSDIVRHLDVGFEYLGNTVLNIKYDRYGVSNEEFKKKFEKTIDQFKPDFIFTYGWWRPYLDIDMYFEIVKKKGVFHVYWAYDDPDCFESMSLPMVRCSDMVFTTLVEYIPKYKEYINDVYLLTHFCNPSFHKKDKENNMFKSDIVLLANNYTIKGGLKFFNDRIKGIENIVDPIANSKYNFSVWGLWWDSVDKKYNLPKKNYRGYISNDFEPQIYSSCKISLGLQSIINSKSHMSNRTFQALACQSFHISQYCESLNYYFKKGVHLEWSSSVEETFQLVDFYLKNDLIRKKISMNGQKLVYEKHTVFNAANQIINKVSQRIK